MLLILAIIEQNIELLFEKIGVYNRNVCPYYCYHALEGSYSQPENTEGEVLVYSWFGLVCFANKNKKFQLSYS
jgi:hypothetical protein